MSPQLALALAQKSIASCGSVVLNRKGLPPLPLKEINKWLRGTWTVYNKGNLNLYVLHDRKTVFLLDNLHQAEDKLNVDRYVKGKGWVKFSFPAAIVNYFKFARGVDIANQLYYALRSGRKGEGAWRRLLWWAIDSCMVNAYKKSGLAEDQLVFRKELFKELVAPFDERASSRGAAPAPGPHVPSGGLASTHYPEHTESERDCSQCSSQPAGQRRRTRYVCHTCSVHLCLGECFGKYHT
jgi:hypothetical protein